MCVPPLSRLGLADITNPESDCWTKTRRQLYIVAVDGACRWPNNYAGFCSYRPKQASKHSFNQSRRDAHEHLSEPKLTEEKKQRTVGFRRTRRPQTEKEKATSKCLSRAMLGYACLPLHLTPGITRSQTRVPTLEGIEVIGA